MQQVQAGAGRNAFKPVGVIRVTPSGPRFDPDAMTAQMSFTPAGCHYNIDMAPASRRIHIGASANGSNIVVVGVPADSGVTRYNVRNPWRPDTGAIAIRGESVVFTCAEHTDGRRTLSVESPLYGEDLRDFTRMLYTCNNKRLPPVDPRPSLVPVEDELPKMVKAIRIRWYA